MSENCAHDGSGIKPTGIGFPSQTLRLLQQTRFRVFLIADNSGMQNYACDDLEKHDLFSCISASVSKAICLAPSAESDAFVDSWFMTTRSSVDIDDPRRRRSPFRFSYPV